MRIQRIQSMTLEIAHAEVYPFTSDLWGWRMWHRSCKSRPFQECPAMWVDREHAEESLQRALDGGGWDRYRRPEKIDVV